MSAARPGAALASEGADLRVCDPVAEIDRCRRLLAALAATPIADFRRGAPPAPGDDLVSVVLPMYEASRWIELCLKGLLAQTHANLEIFCVDDASEDDTYEQVVERFGHEPRIAAIQLRRRVGPYQIKNWVITRLARARWIALQDADDVSHPRRLAAQRQAMMASGARMSGTCAHQFFPAEIAQPIGEGAPIERDGLRHNLAYYPSVAPTTAPDGPETSAEIRLGKAFWRTCRAGPYKVRTRVLADHGTQMLERALFLELGGFDGRTRMAADSDFNLRVVRFHALENLPTVLYSRRFHDRSLTEHPETSLTSAARLRYREQRKTRESEIRAALAAGDLARARELCTSDLHHADVEVRRVHEGFEIRERSDAEDGR